MAMYAADSAASDWSPSRYALWSQRWGDYEDDSQNYPTAIVLRHPTAPYVVVKDDITDETMRRVSYDYLTLANDPTQIPIDPPLNIPPGLISALDPSARLTDPWSFKWLPIGWPRQAGDPDRGPLVSFQALRQGESAGAPLPDRTIIMLATRFIPASPNPICYGFEFGIRIVAHVLQRAETGYEIRITGMSASLPFGVWRNSTSSIPVDLQTNPTSDIRRESDLFLLGLFGLQVRLSIAEVTGLDSNSIQIPAVRLAMEHDIVRTEWSVVGTAPQKLGATPYYLVVAGTPGKPAAFVNKVELVADAQAPGHAWLFPRDPASQAEQGSGKVGALHKRRPTRSEQELYYYRSEVEVTEYEADQLVYPLRPAVGGSAEPPPDDVDELRVEDCPGFVREDSEAALLDANGIKIVDLPGTPDQPHPRSNDFSAISAEYNFAQFFERLRAYGLDAHQYFFNAKLPLKVFYRSGIRPGPGKNGQTVNARVMVEGEPATFEGPPRPNNFRPFLQVHLALANLSTRARKP